MPAQSPLLNRKRLRRSVAVIIALGWHTDRRGFVAIYLLAIVTAALPAAAIWLTKRLIDRLIELPPGAGFSEYSVFLVGLAICLPLQALALEFRDSEVEIAGKRLGKAADARFLASAASSPYPKFEDASWLDRLQRIRTDLDVRPTAMNAQIVEAFSAVLALLFLGGLLLGVHPVLLLLATLSVLLPLPLRQRLNQRIYNTYYDLAPEERGAEYYRRVLSDRSFAKDVRIAKLANVFAQRQSISATHRVNTLSRLWRSSEKVEAAGALCSGLSLALCFSFIAARTASGTLTPGALAALLASVTAIQAGINKLSQSWAAIDEHSRFVCEWDDFTSHIEAPAAQRLPPVRGDRVFELDGVGFAYPGADTNSLSGVTLEVKQGELLAVVGRNGSGKSSLIKLLTGLYEPTEGSLRQSNRVAESKSALFQDYPHYETTIGDSVWLGAPDRNYDEAEILLALQQAQCDFLSRMPTGLNTKLGRLVEESTELSGGEWQRLGLARVFFARRALWVLDEPAAHLDVDAEVAMMEQLRKRPAEATVILVSHRFSTVRNADRIAVLEGGRLVELGSHDELMSRSGLYSELFTSQAEGFS